MDKIQDQFKIKNSQNWELKKLLLLTKEYLQKSDC